MARPITKQGQARIAESAPQLRTSVELLLSLLQRRGLGAEPEATYARTVLRKAKRSR